jgi:hypothetical protein
MTAALSGTERVVQNEVRRPGSGDDEDEVGSAMAFWLKYVALPVAGVIVAFVVISTIVHAILGSLFTLALVGLAAGALYWGYHKVMMEIPAYRRKKLRDKQRKGLY